MKTATRRMDSYMELSHDVLSRDGIQEIWALLSQTAGWPSHITCWGHAVAPSNGALTSSPPSGRGTSYRHHQSAIGRFEEMVKVHLQGIVGWADKPGMLDLGGNLVMHDCLLVFAHDVDAKLEVVLGLEFVGLRLPILRRQASAIDESPVGGFDVPNPNLAIHVRPNLGMLPRQYLAVEVSVDRGWYGLGVRLTANTKCVGIERDLYCLAVKAAVERKQR